MDFFCEMAYEINFGHIVQSMYELCRNLTKRVKIVYLNLLQNKNFISRQVLTRWSVGLWG